MFLSAREDIGAGAEATVLADLPRTVPPSAGAPRVAEELSSSSLTEKAVGGLHHCSSSRGSRARSDPASKAEPRDPLATSRRSARLVDDRLRRVRSSDRETGVLRRFAHALCETCAPNAAGRPTCAACHG